MVVRITRWEEAQISEAGVRQAHVPHENFRISTQRFEPGIRFSGTTREGLVYVLSGSCRWSIDGQQVNAVEGDVAQMPTGSYEFEVVGDHPCDLAHVWNLNELFGLRNKQPAERAGGHRSATAINPESEDNEKSEPA